MKKPICRQYTIKDLKLGQQACFEVTVNEASIKAFARLTGDYSPLHTNEEFARKTQFRSKVAHGLLVYSYVSTLVGMYLPGENATILNHSARYLKPTRANDRLKVSGQVTQKDDILGRIILEVKITNQRQDLVADGIVSVMVNPPAKKGITMKDLKKNDLKLDFKGKTVLITGSSRGIGAACAKLFAYHNANIIINYNLGKSDAEEVLKDITASGRKAVCLKADVTNSQEVQKMVQQALKKFPRIDILVNNAMNNALPLEFQKLEWVDMQKDIDVALKGAFNCIKSVLPGMLKNGYGKVINVTTVYANSAPPSGFTKYVTAKTALLGLTRSLAIEFAPKNIFFNVISPGFTDTDLGAHVPQWLKDKLALENPQKRLAQPIDIAKAILIMASSYTDYVTGNQMLACGGSVMI